MNCTSEYPPILNDLNLSYIKKMKTLFKNAVIGHSDHTSDIYTSVVAAAFGAKFIEKHIYITDKFKGPDKDVSISIDQLKSLSNILKKLPLTLDNKKKIHSKEKPIRQWAFRSIVAMEDLKKGKIIKKNMIWSKRPGTGIPSYKMSEILGGKMLRNVKKNTLLKSSDYSKK